MTQELKKYCLEQAISSGAGSMAFDLAQKYYDWLNDKKNEDLKAVDISTITTGVGGDGKQRKEFRPQRLTKTQASVLRVAINVFDNENALNGTSLSKIAKIHQTSANRFLRILTGKGYLRRAGYSTYTPVYLPSGEKYERPVTVYPPAPARGYQPLKAKLGEIGRVA